METMTFASYLNKKQSAPRDKLAAIMELAATYGERKIEIDFPYNTVTMGNRILKADKAPIIDTGTPYNITNVLSSLEDWGCKYTVQYEPLIAYAPLKINSISIVW